MKVEMLTTAAGPDGVYLAGSTVILPRSLAIAFIEAHAAKPVRSIEPERAVEIPVAERAAKTKTVATKKKVAKRKGKR